MTENRLTVWKQRGNYLRRRWGKPDGSRYPYGTLERPEAGPPTIAGPPKTEDETRAELEARIITTVRDNPGVYSRSRLADTVKGNRSRNLDAIDRLLVAGTFGERSPGRGAKLAVRDEPL